MLSNDSLKSLSLLELQILLEHIRLGPDHLKRLLSKDQMREILHIGDLTPEQRADILSNKLEKSGNVAIILNTIITSTFGAWMGLSGCIGLDLGSLPIFSAVVVLAILLSALMGYQSYQVLRQQLLSAIKSQKLANLELKILEAISAKQRAKTRKVEKTLCRAVQGDTLHEKNLTLQDDEAVKVWLKQLSTLFTKKINSTSITEEKHALQSEWRFSIGKIKKILNIHLELEDHLSSEAPSANEDFARLKKHYNHLSGLELLIDPSFAVPKTEPVKPSWLEKNARFLLVGIAPTLLGGFASMFVFVGGIPNIAKAFGLSNVFALLTHPYARVIELGLAVLATVYFGFAYLYTQRKMLQRQNYLNETQQKITNAETAMLATSARLKMLYKVKHYLNRLVFICREAIG